jgi:CHASE3 domain sensor protein
MAQLRMELDAMSGQNTEEIEGGSGIDQESISTSTVIITIILLLFLLLIIIIIITIISGV